MALEDEGLLALEDEGLLALVDEGLLALVDVDLGLLISAGSDAELFILSAVDLGLLISADVDLGLLISADVDLGLLISADVDLGLPIPRPISWVGSEFSKQAISWARRLKIVGVYVSPIVAVVRRCMMLGEAVSQRVRTNKPERRLALLGFVARTVPTVKLCPK